MAQPSQINALRSTDFPEGVASKDTADKLFQILNPFLQQVGTTTTAGTSLGQNIDGQFAQADIGKGSAWLPMTLESPFAGNSFTPWPQPSYRVDGTGRLWCRGLFTAATQPASTQMFWKLPKPLLAPTDSSDNVTNGTGRLFMVPYTDPGAARGFVVRMDAGANGLSWGDGQGCGFGVSGETAESNLALNANVIGNWSMTKNGDGRVFVRGNLGTNVGGITTGWSPGTIAVGYRPAQAQTFSISIQTAAAAFGAGILTIATNGVIQVFWSIGAMQIGALGVSGINYLAATDTPITPSTIAYGSLDQISWDTKGGPSMSTRPGFPLNIRLKDGKKPVAVLCWAVNKESGNTEVVTQPGWIANGAGNTGNQLTITSVQDLRDDQAYTLNFFIFF